MSSSAGGTFSIRSAVDGDQGLLLQFIKELAEFEKMTDEVVAEENVLRESFFGARPSAEALIVEKGGEPVAFAVYFENFSTFKGRAGLYLEDLFVRPAFRKQGIGKALLVHLAGIAKKRGCSRFEWVALDWNENAIQFYERLGARKVEEWKIFRLSGDNLDKLATSDDL